MSSSLGKIPGGGGMIMTAVRENIAEMQRNRGWILLLGIVLVLLGTMAIIYTVTATFATMAYLGWFLMIAGVFEVAGAFYARHWGGFFLDLLMGVLLIVAGIITLNHKGDVAVLLTGVIAFFFMVGGVTRILAAFTMRFCSWGWVVLSGLISFMLGMMIWQQWPSSALWVPGTLVGIELLFSGWNYVALASWLKRVKPEGA
ncbi:MAG TPA: HdeD family acid-resistance protein [Gemmatales bacterium]|nr:HdeD family acid-resistance protein [Gemmatales bacterium]